MDKIEAIAKKDKRNGNEIIEQFLDEKTSGLFISMRHKLEFRNLMLQANMFRNDLDYCSNERMVLKILAFMYLIAAYQGDYKLHDDEKFKLVLNDEGGSSYRRALLTDFCVLSLIIIIVLECVCVWKWLQLV